MSDFFGNGDNTGAGGYTHDDGAGQSQGDNGTGINPAWNEYLADVPQEQHEHITKAFRRWDGDVNKRLETVQSKYKPWDDIVTKYDKDEVKFGIDLANQIKNDPRALWDVMGEHFKFGTVTEDPEGKQGQGQEPNPNQDYLNRVSAVERQNQIIASHLYEQKQAQEQARQDALLDAEIGKLKKAHGDFDERALLAFSQMTNGDLSEAMKALQDYNKKVAEQYKPPPPFLMSPGGGVPNNRVDPAKMGQKDIKALVAHRLSEAARQRNQ